MYYLVLIKYSLYGRFVANKGICVMFYTIFFKIDACKWSINCYIHIWILEIFFNILALKNQNLLVLFHDTFSYRRMKETVDELFQCGQDTSKKNQNRDSKRFSPQFFIISDWSYLYRARVVFMFTTLNSLR
jgi:hypothetical protein